MFFRSEAYNSNTQNGGELVIELSASAVLLDIEGTVSPVSFVYDVLFPFARENARSFLQKNWDSPALLPACDLLAEDAGFSDSYVWLNGLERVQDMIDRVMTEVNKLMDADSKSRGLKELQGLIWADGYESGKLQSKLFEDVPQALACWKASGHLIAIYSSGSSTAQRVLFQYTEFGDLTDYFSGFFDTSCGAKRDASSYEMIAARLSRQPEQVVFVSDVLAELDAASSIGMKTLHMVRPGNNDPAGDKHSTVKSFYDVQVLVPEAANS